MGVLFHMQYTLQSMNINYYHNTYNPREREDNDYDAIEVGERGEEDRDRERGPLTPNAVEEY